MMEEYDTKLLLYIQEHHRKKFLNPVMILITNAGNAIWFIIGFYLCLSGADTVTGTYILVTIFMAWGATSLCLKPLIGRKRAFHAIPGLVSLIPEPRDKAFPSAHSAMAFAGAFSIMLRLPIGAGLAAVLWAVIMGYSRMYVGVHYLSDILGGAVTGLVCAVLCRVMELL